MSKLVDQLLDENVSIDDILRFLTQLRSDFVVDSKDSVAQYTKLQQMHKYKTKLTQIQLVLYIQYPAHSITIGKQKGSYDKVIALVEEFNLQIDSLLLSLLQEISRKAEKQQTQEIEKRFDLLKAAVLFGLDYKEHRSYLYAHGSVFYTYMYFGSLLAAKRRISYFYVVLKIDGDTASIYLEPEFMLPYQLAQPCLVLDKKIDYVTLSNDITKKIKAIK